MKMIICQESSINNIKKIIQNQVTFLQQYEYMCNMYTLDYFVCDHWNQIPKQWQKELRNFEAKDLGKFLDSREHFRFNSVLPLSLLAFRASANVLSLPHHMKNPLNNFEQFLCEIHNLPKTATENHPCEDSCSETKLLLKSSQYKDLPEYCRRHVKLKKQHEIYHLSQIIHLALRKAKISHAVDIGAGLGHLSRLLCLKYNLSVTTVEANDIYVSTAFVLDKEALLRFKKVNTTDVTSDGDNTEYNIKELPYHHQISIYHSSHYGILESVIRRSWAETDNSSQHDKPFGLFGLHTCGDLAANLLRLFINLNEARVLLSLGCCYMKLTTDKSSKGFPLSDFVSQLNINLSTEAREIACHAIEKYIERLKENAESLKVHCYRALLEKLIVKNYPNMKHLGLKGVKHAEKMSFHEYVIKALKNTSLKIPDSEITSVNEAYLKEWKNVVVVYSLRLLTAPVIESLIYLDRMMFLYENGLKSCVFPVFDPLISPRNYLLFSWKPS